MSSKKKHCVDEELIMELKNEPEKGGWIIIPPSGQGIPASLFEICLWNEILRLRTKVVYLKAQLEKHEQT